MTPETIERLNELRAKTTQGEWFHVTEEPEGEDYCEPPPTQHAVSIYEDDTADAVAWTGDEIWAEGDAQWIAAIHNAWPSIAAELMRLRELHEFAERYRPQIAAVAGMSSDPHWADIAVVISARFAKLTEREAMLRKFEAEVREAFGAQRDFAIVQRVDSAIERLDLGRETKDARPL